MSTTVKGDNPVPEGPQIKAETWFAMAIAAFFVTLCIFGTVALWVFSADPGEMQPRAQAFTPFGAALIAVVTFLTIAWRGVLNTKQLEYQATQITHQAAQLDQARRQNDAKDEENLAKLLMDGTKLLGDLRESHVLAGIAALQAVASSPSESFASHAMDILADLVEENYRANKPKVMTAAIEGLGRGAKLSRFAARSIVIDLREQPEKSAQLINGIRSLRYIGAAMIDFSLTAFSDPRRVSFEDCSFDSCAINARTGGYKNCKFADCEIKFLTVASLVSNTFEVCNFSEFKLEGNVGRRSRRIIESLIGNQNYYHAALPPVPKTGIVWSDVLNPIYEIDAEIEFEDLEDA